MIFSPDIAAEREISQLESKRVRLVLQEFGLLARQPEVFAANFDRSGERRLTFAAFDAVFPDFPIYFAVESLYKLVSHSSCSQTAMFRDFRNCLPLDKFQTALERVWRQARRRPVGLLYRWEGIRHGLILHNGDFPTEGFKQTYTEAGECFTVEHFRRFLKTLAAAPDNYEAEKSPAEVLKDGKKLPPTASVWELVQRASGIHEIRLLSFLIEVLYHMPPAQSRKWIVRCDGERWINIPQKRLAKLLGTSERTVQRTVAALSEKGLIERARNSSFKNEMRLGWQAFSEGSEDHDE